MAYAPPPANSTDPENLAAVLPSKAKLPEGALQVLPAPYPKAGPGELIVRSRALGLNAAEWYKQDLGTFVFGYLPYPFIQGSDVAGEVVSVGPPLTSPGKQGEGRWPARMSFTPGDRVLAMALGPDFRSKESRESAFQNFVVVRAYLAVKIPDSMTLEEACALPLTFCTAATGLFTEKNMALELPPADPAKVARGSRGQVIVIWGASTAVGTNAVQLAAAAGYTVIATAGKHNFDYVKSLGAFEVFDYRDKDTVVENILASIGNTPCVGTIAIGAGSVKPCLAISSQVKKPVGKKGRYVCQLAALVPEVPPNKDGVKLVFPEGGGLKMAGFLAEMAWMWAGTQAKKAVKGVGMKFVWGSDLVDEENVVMRLFAEFLPAALASGTYLAKPDPMIVGHGLDKLQEAYEVGKRGVSAKKIVVTL